MVKTISKVGNSQGIIFDSALMELAHLKAGDEMNVEVHDGGTITLTPLRPRPSRAEVSKVINVHDEGLRPDDEEAGVKTSPDNCFHLTAEIAREIHAEAIAKFGGSDGVREMALLESAVAAPQASIGGKSPYADLAEVAAAYLYYLCKNHPFIDGNKRTALGACIVFLRLNGIEPKADEPEWEELTLAVAAGTIDRDETTARLRRLLP